MNKSLVQLSNIQWFSIFKSKGWLLELLLILPTCVWVLVPFILLYNWTWWWYYACIYLSTISPLMHVMIYVLIYSRTSKGLSLGELISAFYIIIYTTYIIILECYWNYYINVLHVLDDFGYFHTKSLFLIFNIWEAENSHFIVFIGAGATGTQMEKGKLHNSFCIRRTRGGKRSKREEPRGPK